LPGFICPALLSLLLACEFHLCEKCAEFESRIVSLRRLTKSLTDPGTINAAKTMIKEMEADRLQVHSVVDHEFEPELPIQSVSWPAQKVA